MMLRRIAVAVALLGAIACAGCFSFDARHNRKHWKIIKKDLRLIHQDIDFRLGLDEPSYLDSSLR